MDCTETVTQMAEEELLPLEPLVITEDGDVTASGPEELLLKGDEASEMCSEKQQRNAEESPQKEDEPREHEDVKDGLNRNESASDGETLTQNADAERSSPSGHQAGGAESQEEDPKKVGSFLWRGRSVMVEKQRVFSFRACGST